ncbi:MAG: NAD-dependent epimerase/dehydratase family protein [Acidobacteriota bacterium]|nr:NAD-dependent epimerase/dehydratase family protein [Acidobacteriota bacterium]MDE3263593.1 NAD-dependent epimerase/dehydratase family protein [Acidobacteriota bacterium]
MTALVTGGTGFVGAHVVRALLARGEDRVRCLARPGGDRSNLEGCDVEIVEGDLRDPASLRAACAGCVEVYHCAADYRLFVRRPRDIYASNVDGTRHLLAAAAEAGAKRIVYTSSVGALGLEPGGRPATETTPVSVSAMVGHYKRSKYLAERVAVEAAAAGAPVVIVNPSTPVGELDVKPTPTGRIIVDFLAGRLPAYVDTGLNVIDVRDVAQGHLLAAEHGRVGEKYILGHRNVLLVEMLRMLADITGLQAPRLRLPHWLPVGAAALATGWARLAGGEPRVALDSALMARRRMFFDAGRAVRELGLVQSPIREALQRAVRWFEENGYVKGPRR